MATCIYKNGQWVPIDSVIDSELDGASTNPVQSKVVKEALDKVSPPMVFGTEYLTAERNNGKAVYAKAVDIGTLLASSGTKTVATATGSIVRADGIIKSGNYCTPLPYRNNDGTKNAFISIWTDGSVGVTTLGDMSDYSATLTLYYTKG